MLRTYPVARPPYPFAPQGERTVARGYTKAIRRARRLIYIEDQYLWSTEVANLFADALRANPGLHLVAVVPRYPDVDGALAMRPNLVGREQALELCRGAAGDRVHVFDVENHAGTPVYVHAKVCVVDDVWACVGSDNFNRRSWSHDSELSCAVLDATPDGRAPADPAGLGDGARRFARDLRLRLLCEHLDRAGGQDTDLLDPASAIAAITASAQPVTRVARAWPDRSTAAGPVDAARAGARRPVDPVVGIAGLSARLRPRRAAAAHPAPGRVVGTPRTRSQKGQRDDRGDRWLPERPPIPTLISRTRYTLPRLT